MCTVTLDPCGDLPFLSWGRWQCLRGGADGLNGCSAACGCGTDKKKEDEAAVYETRPIMPRAGARAGETGDAGGAVAPTEVRCEFLKSSFFVVAVFLVSRVQ